MESDEHLNRSIEELTGDSVSESSEEVETDESGNHDHDDFELSSEQMDLFFENLSQMLNYAQADSDSEDEAILQQEKAEDEKIEELFDFDRSAEQIIAVIEQQPNLRSLLFTTYNPLIASMTHPDRFKLVLYFLNAGLDPDQGTQTSTPLIAAIEELPDSMPTIELLLTSGANLDAQINGDGMPPLGAILYASPSAARTELIERCLELPVDLELAFDLEAEDGDRLTMTALLIATDNAIQRQDYEPFDRLLEVGADPNRVTQTSPLNRAISAIRYPGAATTIEKLLAAGADFNLRANGFTPIELAALLVAEIESAEPVFNRLIEAGASYETSNDQKNTLVMMMVSEINPGDEHFTEYEERIVPFLEQHRAKGMSLIGSNIDGWTALHAAMYGGSEVVVDYLLEQGLDPNQPNEKGITPTMFGFAHHRIDLDLIEKLRSAGGDLGRLTDSGKSLLMVELDHPDPDTPERVEMILGSGGETYIDLEYPETEDRVIHRVAEHLDQKPMQRVMSKLLAAGADPNAPGEAGRTPLMVVARLVNTSQVSGNAALIELLAASDVNRVDQLGHTALNCALMNPNRNPGLIQQLIMKSDDLDRREKQGNTSLLIAAQNLEYGAEPIDWLIEAGADPSLSATDGSNLLMWWAISGSIGLINKYGPQLLDLGVSVDATIDSGETALHLACSKANEVGGAWDCALWLLDHGATIDRLDQNQQRPQYYLSQLDHLKEFARRGADLTLVSGRNWTQLMFAVAKTTTPAVVDYLIADIGIEVNHQTDPEDRETALVLLMSAIDAREKLTKNDEQLFTRLLAHGADPSYQTTEKTSMLLVSVSHSWRPLTQQLLEAGADPDASNGEGATPLMLAGRLNDGPTIEMLLKYGADPTLQNHLGWSAAMLTADSSWRSVLESKTGEYTVPFEHYPPEKECVACYEPVTTVLHPCTHSCLCAACVTKVDRCPICREEIQLPLFLRQSQLEGQPAKI